MHELGLARDFFQSILNEAEKNDLKAINKIRIKIGIGSGIEAHLLRHSFEDHLFPGTVAEGAELEIVQESTRVKCRDCGKELSGDEDFSLSCPYCGGFNMQIESGRDISFEILDPDIS